jgi:hypothetical protein
LRHLIQHHLAGRRSTANWAKHSQSISGNIRYLPNEGALKRHNATMPMAQGFPTHVQPQRSLLMLRLRIIEKAL